MFEAANHRMWDLTSGFLEWKLNACWPSIQWQIYDYFLRPTASYYAIKRAAAPVSVLLCPLDRTVSVVNNTRRSLTGYTCEVCVLDLDATVRWRTKARVDRAPDSVGKVLALPDIPAPTSVYFVHLELLDRDSRRVAENFYWLPNRPPGADDTGCLADLGRLPRVPVRGSVRRLGGETADVRFRVELRNPSAAVALLVRARLLDRRGEEILPAWWSDNYLCLPPGASRRLTVELPAAVETPPVLAVDGWNVERGGAAESLSEAEE
jgi:exo-1,4-beta-D-glucosaminidase